MNSGHIDLLCASTVLTKHFQHTKSLYPCHNLERPSPFFRRGNQGLEGSKNMQSQMQSKWTELCRHPMEAQAGRKMAMQRGPKCKPG